jgi:prepilin-type N-terminal cleavage/methylation domain-containing protein
VRNNLTLTTTSATLRRRRAPRGMGLVELLIALSISAALLTAVAVATDSSFRAYAINEEQANLTQRARLSVHRMLTYIRTCKEHQPITDTEVTRFAQGFTVTDTGISMFTENGMQLDFEFDPANRRLLLLENGAPRELLEGVEAFSMKLEPMRSPAAMRSGGAFDLLKRATILLTIKTTGQSADIDEDANGQLVTMSASVMPRRNTW